MLVFRRKSLLENPWNKLAKLGLIVSFIDYDYDYYGYGDYRGGYSDPYYDDYYRYEDYYYDYPPAPPQARGRGRQPQPVGGLVYSIEKKKNQKPFFLLFFW